MSLAKNFTAGKWILFIGVLVAAYGFFFYDITVPSDYGDRVINLGLMDQRRNILISGGILAIIGAILIPKRL